MIASRSAALYDYVARKFAKTPFHPVADDGVADFLGDCEADTLLLVAVGAIADKENEAGHRCPFRSIGGQEIPARGNNA